MASLASLQRIPDKEIAPLSYPGCNRRNALNALSVKITLSRAP